MNHPPKPGPVLEIGFQLRELLRHVVQLPLQTLRACVRWKKKKEPTSRTLCPLSCGAEGRGSLHDLAAPGGGVSSTTATPLPSMAHWTQTTCLLPVLVLVLVLVLSAGAECWR